MIPEAITEIILKAKKLSVESMQYPYNLSDPEWHKKKVNAHFALEQAKGYVENWIKTHTNEELQQFRGG